MCTIRTAHRLNTTSGSHSTWSNRSHPLSTPTGKMSSYYSPSHLQTDAQKAPLTFDLPCPHLSALNNGSSITPGTRLDLPLWLAEMLAVSKPGGPGSASLATLDLPAALGPRVLNALRADPVSVDLRAQAPWFYGLGERMLELFDEEEVGDVLTDVRMLLKSSICYARHLLGGKIGMG